jgi:hypothetical protein
MWLGQTPLVDYIENTLPNGRIETRCHYEFRWWYEYSGGKLTDWGAHHVDIAQWAIGMDHSGPTLVEPVHARHPVPFKDGYPTVSNQYNTATEFKVRCAFPNGAEIVIQDSTPYGNGVYFEGTKGSFHVGRSVNSLYGDPVNELKTNPLPSDLLATLYKGKKPGHHMGNFAECVKTREQPISDVYTHHRAITTCHLANIAIRLGRSIKWDAQAQQIVGDKEAQAFNRAISARATRSTPDPAISEHPTRSSSAARSLPEDRAEPPERAQVPHARRSRRQPQCQRRFGIGQLLLVSHEHDLRVFVIELIERHEKPHLDLVAQSGRRRRQLVVL